MNVEQMRESIAFDTPDAIRSRAADCGYFGIRLREPDAEEGLVLTPAFEEKLVVWLDRESPWFTAERLTPKDLEAFEIPTWTGIGPNDLEGLYRELYEEYGMHASYAPRYCISREDFFLNRVYPGDAVILTEGSEHISAVRVRGERGLRSFEPPIYVRTYVCFREQDVEGPRADDSAVGAFRSFLEERFAASRAVAEGGKVRGLDG